MQLLLGQSLGLPRTPSNRVGSFGAGAHARGPPGGTTSRGVSIAVSLPRTAHGSGQSLLQPNPSWRVLVAAQSDSRHGIFRVNYKVAQSIRTGGRGTHPDDGRDGARSSATTSSSAPTASGCPTTRGGAGRTSSARGNSSATGPQRRPPSGGPSPTANTTTPCARPPSRR